MNFQDLKKIEKYDWYLDVAFRRAKERTEKAREKKCKTRLDKSKFVESTRIQNVEGSLTKYLDHIVKSYPSIDELPEFYNKLIKTTLDYKALKKSLGAMSWAQSKIRTFTSSYVRMINKTPELQNVNKLRREYYGRISSVMKQIKDNLLYLDECRKIMRKYPTIKTSVPTIALAGFPNVGKTTLLYKLSGSKPEINNYAFTTKNINVAYIREDKLKLQLLDTPGTLNRKEKMNYIEHQADLALDLCAEFIVYVFDLTITYPIEDQIKLYKNILKYQKPTLIYFSKSDLIPKEEISAFAKDYKDTFSDAEKLKKHLLEHFQKV